MSARSRTDRGAIRRGTLWAAAGGGALLFAFWAEHVRGMAPCALCLWERLPYRLLLAAGAVWILLGTFGRAGRALWSVVLLIVLVALGMGVLHFGVEQHWWPSPLPECAAPHFRVGTSFAERLASMPARPAKPCDAANYPIEGLPISLVSMALIYALLLLAVALITGPGRTRIFGPARTR